MPGLNELNLTDFTRIMNNRLLDYWIVSFISPPKINPSFSFYFADIKLSVIL
jgi:hypothetical protein